MYKIEKVTFLCKLEGEFASTDAIALTMHKKYHVTVVDTILCKIKEGRNPLNDFHDTEISHLFNMIINLKFL